MESEKKLGQGMDFQSGGGGREKNPSAWKAGWREEMFSFWVCVSGSAACSH